MRVIRNWREEDGQLAKCPVLRHSFAVQPVWTSRCRAGSDQQFCRGA